MDWWTWNRLAIVAGWLVGLAMLGFAAYIALMLWSATRIESGMERPPTPFPTHDLMADRAPRWTSDGGSLVINMGTQITVGPEEQSIVERGTNRLYGISARGLGVWPIADGRGDEQLSPSVSLDNQVVYASYDHGRSSRSWVEIVDLEGGEPKRIKEAIVGSLQVWSPDGSAFAVSVEGGLAIFSSDGAQVREIVYIEPSGNIMDIAWANDSRHLALSRGWSSHNYFRIHRIEVLDTQGSEHYIAAEVESESSSDYSKPAWSPDGSRLYFTEQAITSAGQQTTLYFVDTPGGTRHKVAELGEDVNVVYVKASPDGQRLLFRSQGGPFGRLSGLYTISPEGRDLTMLLRFQEYASWSPSGDRIAAFDGFRLWVMNADGTGLRLLTVPGPDGRPSPHVGDIFNSS